MKNLYACILVLIVGICQGQKIKEETVGFQSQSEHIHHAESLAAARLLNAQQPGNLLSVASSNFDVNYYRCEWQLDPAVKYISGKITSYFTITSSTDTIAFDLSSQLTVDSVLFRGAKITFEPFVQNGLRIQFPSLLNIGQRDSVSIFYKGVPDSQGFGSFYQGFYRGAYAMWTLSEPYGAKDWWPCKIGLNDKADSVDILVTTPQEYITSSNGILSVDSIAGSNRTSYFKHRYPIASYLIAIAITNYVVVKDSIELGGRQMPVLTYTYPFARDYFLPATDVAKKCLGKFSELFGIYPFYKELYCQTAWGWSGGMEHQTNSFIVDRWPTLVSHELGHQWFGDKVTCGSWQDLWLNEGFATYTTNIYYEHFEPGYYKTLLNNISQSITSQPDGSVWIDDTTDLRRLFNGRLTYNKGSYVVHMLRWVLGDSLFFRGIREYLQDSALAYGYARTSDLKRVLERVSGKNLTTFFNNWIYGEGYPNYHATYAQNANNWVKVNLTQTTSDTSVKFYDMPVPIVFRGQGREATFVVDHKFSGQDFWLNVGFVVDSIVIDPDLWILAKTKTSQKVAGSSTIDEIKVYPNPSNNRPVYVSLKNPSDRKLSLYLFNSLGQLLYQNQVETPGNDEAIVLPITNFPKGVYWLKLKSEKSINTVKKIVKR